MNIRINQNPTLRERIDIYYHNSHLSHPNGLESLLLLITELDELAAAYVETSGQPENPDAIAAFAALDLASEIAEKTLMKKSGLVRNNQPAGTVDLPGEIADCLMLLDRFADAANQPEPHTCLNRKLTKKLNEGKSL